MAESQGYLPQIGKADAWSWVFFGAGLYGLLGSLWRAASPRYSNPLTGVYLWAAFLMIIGLGGATGLKITWPLILGCLALCSWAACYCAAARPPHPGSALPG